MIASVSKASAITGQIVFTFATCAAVVIAGGGLSFLERPVGIAYLTLWFLWWLVAAIGRTRGVTSVYDRTQRILMPVFYVLLLVGLIIAVPWEYAHFNRPIPRDRPSAYFGLLLFAGGVILQGMALRALGAFYTSRLGIQLAHRLVTSGPYRYVRHPGYLSSVICLFGISFALSSLIALGIAVVTIPILRWRLKFEEKMLLEAFGEEYRAYMRKTRRLIPLVY